MKKSIKSLIILVILISGMSFYRLNNVKSFEISWDVLGYYLYLPATFVHDDPLLTDITWLKEQNADNKLTGTYYMISSNEKGENMYFFLMGMSAFYAPSFAVSHFVAAQTGAPTDGFSMPYQYGLVIGGLIYSLIGLIYFRKILLRYLSDNITSLVLLTVVLGTNYIHHLTLDNLGTVNILFMLVSLITWNTIRWRETKNYYRLIPIGIFSILVALVKPSEVFVVLIPLLWEVTSFKLLKDRFIELLSNWKMVVLTILICLLIASPQMYYWYLKTGKVLYDSYKNPGVGLDFLSPHISDVLFSYRKGWLIYTPVMILSIIGFVVLYRNNKPIFFALFIYSFIAFYIIASWSEWWYGAAFSTRPMIAIYPLLGLSIGYTLKAISEKKLWAKTVVAIFVLSCVFLNQFQWWQMKEYILDPYRTTKEYYWRTFLKTSVTAEDREYLLIYRDFTGKMELNNPEDYVSKQEENEDFTNHDKLKTPEVVFDSTYAYYQTRTDQEFFPLYEKRYREISEKDHFWVKAKLKVRYDTTQVGARPLVINTMDRKNGSYGYFATECTGPADSLGWITIETLYLTPEIRTTRDKFKLYLWNRHGQKVDVDDVSVEVLEKKD